MAVLELSEDTGGTFFVSVRASDGGASTGPRIYEGRQRIAEALRRL